jgi:hypothetical protein
MTAPIIPHRLTRRAVLGGSVLTVTFAFAGVRAQALAEAGTAAPQALDPNDVDSFLSVNSDGTVTVFCGKVDLGQGLRIAIRQIAGEELGIGVDKIQYVEGDTALTPDQGRTSGSSGIQRGGMQIRQAAATAREALIGLAAQQLQMNPDNLVANDGQVLPKSGGSGIPFADTPHTILEVVDLETGERVLPIGEKGEICFRGPQVMTEYWKKPEATEEASRGGRFHTGDIGFLDQDGFVTLVDRKKDMILSGGFNVFPHNIEEAIYEHPAVAEVTVIGIPDEYRGQSAKAFIALKPGHAAFGIDELKAFLADKLARYEMPTEMEIRASLPRTPVGKLSKKELVAEEIAKRQAPDSRSVISPKVA